MDAQRYFASSSLITPTFYESINKKIQNDICKPPEGDSNHTDQLDGTMLPSGDPDNLLNPLLDKRISQVNSEIHLGEIKVIILFVSFIIIEVIVLCYCLLSSWIFEYCYWEFGAISYHKNVDKLLMSCNNEGSTSDMFYELGCPVLEVGECPDICNLASGIRKGKNYLTAGICLDIALVLVALAMHLWSMFNGHLGLKRGVLAGLLFGSLVFFVLGLCGYFFQSGFSSLREPQILLEVDNESPRNLKVLKGTYIAICTLIFMVLYRALIVFLHK